MLIQKLKNSVPLAIMLAVLLAGVAGCNTNQTQNEETGLISINTIKDAWTPLIDISEAKTICSILEGMGYDPVVTGDFPTKVSNQLDEDYLEIFEVVTCYTENFPSLYWQDQDVEVEGRLFNNEDSSNNAKLTVIGADTATQLFQDSRDIIGSDIEVSGYQFKVIGIFKYNPALGEDEDSPSFGIYIPLATAASLGLLGEVYDISLWLNNIDSLEKEAKQICKKLSEEGFNPIVSYFDEEGRKLGEIRSRD